jgi:fatty acid desaturase
MVAAMGAPDLAGLRSELRDAGMFERRELRSWLELAVLATALAACLVAVSTYGWLAVPLLPAGSVIATTIAMYGHEGSHRSFSESPRRNELLTYLAFALFSGMSTSYWRNKHDRAHHATPNVEGQDPDIKPFPFASSSGGHAVCGPKERFFQRHFQRWLFWPMSTLMVVGIRRSSLVHLARAPRTREWALEVACLVAHYTLWVIVPTIVWGLAGFAVYAAIWAGVGVLLALIFAPAHMGLPVAANPKQGWTHQLATTRNLEMPRAMSFFFVGLDYQIEHHLFPKIPHANLRRAAEISRAWCERHGVTYISTPYVEALAGSIGFMGTAWRYPAIVIE